MTNIRRIRPVGLGWTFCTTIRIGDVASDLWLHMATSTQVLSSIDDAEQPKSGKTGPQWHVSIVDRSDYEPSRASAAQIELARCAFGMLEAEEDNHHPGAASHFWLPVDPNERVDCECKTTEVTVEEPDGYRWTNPTDGACRGCEYERVMIAAGRPTHPCPIHQAAVVQERAGI